MLNFSQKDVFVFRDSFSLEDLLEAKQAGFSDRQLAKLIGVQESDMRNERLKHGVKPWVKQVCIVNKSQVGTIPYLA